MNPFKDAYKQTFFKTHPPPHSLAVRQPPNSLFNFEYVVKRVFICSLIVCLYFQQPKQRGQASSKNGAYSHRICAALTADAAAGFLPLIEEKYGSTSTRQKYELSPYPPEVHSLLPGQRATAVKAHQEVTMAIVQIVHKDL
jgi:hypothetical protein